MKRKRYAPRPPAAVDGNADRTTVAAGPRNSGPSRRRLGHAAAAGAVLLLLGLGAVAWTGEFWPFSNPRALPAEDALPKINALTPPGPAPAGMVWVPGGEFWMGIDLEDYANAPRRVLRDFTSSPLHKVYVDGFWMDRTEVTNEEFARFVKATGYVTVAERKPEPKDFPPETPVEALKDPFSIVFHQPKRGAYDLDSHQGWMELRKGACWRHPEGVGSDIAGRARHPAVHICWHDAIAYGKWANKRLPTEAEWEFAARGGLDRKKYCWGDEQVPGGKRHANTWQGPFPERNDVEDGYPGTAPVGSFPANGYGLFDMAGNVWEWCADFYRDDYYLESPAKNPEGPVGGFDPAEPGVAKRVQRGGSFLCADNYCMRYLPGARGKGEPTSAASHVGFRCVRDP